MWIVAQHLIQMAGHPQQRLMAWAGLMAPWLTVVEATKVLGDVAMHPVTWKADSLAWRLLKLTDALTGSLLKIKTIGAIDCKQNRARQQASKSIKKAFQIVPPSQTLSRERNISTTAYAAFVFSAVSPACVASPMNPAQAAHHVRCRNSRTAAVKA